MKKSQVAPKRIEDLFDYTVQDLLNSHYATDPSGRRFPAQSIFAQHSFSDYIPAIVSSFGLFNLLHPSNEEHVALFTQRSVYKSETKGYPINDVSLMQDLICSAWYLAALTKHSRTFILYERSIIGIKKKNISAAAARFLAPMCYPNEDTLIDKTFIEYSHLIYDNLKLQNIRTGTQKVSSQLDFLLDFQWDIAYFLFPHYTSRSHTTGIITLTIPEGLPGTISDYIHDIEQFLAYILYQADLASNYAHYGNEYRTQYKSLWSEAWHKIQQRVNDHNQGAHVLGRLAFGLPLCGEDETQEQLSKRYFDYLRTRQSYLLALLGAAHLYGRKSLKDIIEKFEQNKYCTSYISGIGDLVPTLEFERDAKAIQWLSIPNGEIGTHAIYNILENIIRNTAKHSKGITPQNFRFSIQIKDYILINEIIDIDPLIDDFMLEVVQYGKDRYDHKEPPRYIDNSQLYAEIAKRDEVYRQKLSQMYAIYIYEHTEYDEDEAWEIVDKINNLIAAPILDRETLELRNTGWGLIEMKTAAAYLRQIPRDMIDDVRYRYNPNPNINDTAVELPLLRAVVDEVEGGKFRIGYSFFVRKPEFALIITGDNELTKALEDPIVASQGIYPVAPDQIDWKKTYNHEIVIIDSQIGEEVLKQIKAQRAANRFTTKLTTASADKIREYIIEKGKDEKAKNHLDKFVSALYYNQQKSIFPNPLHRGIKSFFNIEDTTIKKDLKIYYLDHGNGISEYEVVGLNDSANPKAGGNVSKEEAAKTSVNFLEIIHSLTQKHNPVTADRYYTLPLKVVVLDERVQEAGQTQRYTLRGGNEILYKTLYQYTNIQVPEQEAINYSVANYSVSCLKETIKYLETHSSDAYFFVMHIEVIEKLIYAHNQDKAQQQYSLDKAGIECFLTQILFAAKAVDLSRIVILSGKGVPTNLPTSVRFLHLSNIAEYILGQERNKYAFMETLFSSRGIIV